MNVLIDGFKFSEWAGGKKLLQVQSDHIEKYIAYCNMKQIKMLHVSPYHGYKFEDLNFLSRCPQVERIHLQDGFKSYDGLYQLPRLNKLSANFKHEINFAAIPSLIELSTEWNSKIDETLFAAKGLKWLALRGYKPKSQDLRCMENLKKIRELHIILSPIQSIHGIEAISQLEKLEVSYCRNLEDIQALLKQKKSLRELEIQNCKKIPDLTIIKNLNLLKKAILANTGSLPSLEFVRKMPQLEFLSFVGTDVIDGDMTPCFNLKYAGFLNKRHYSHTFEEVEKMQGRRK